MRRFYRIAAAAALLVIPAQAYYHYVHYTGRSAPFTAQYEKFNVHAVTFFVSDQGPAVFAPNDTFGSLLGQVKQALAAWDSVSTSDLRVVFGGLESRDQVSNTPGGDVVFDDLPPGLLGLGMPISNGTTIVRSTVTLANNTNQGSGPSYYEKFFTTAVHEVGHALGLQHTWTSSAMSQDIIRNTSRARPLDADDVAALSLLYGKANWQAEYGSISGRVTFANGSPAVLASVVAINPTGSAVSALTNPDGTYRIDGIPAANYMLYVHPLPPDAAPADGTGIRLPQDQNGQVFQPSSPFGTVFYPGTTDVTQAQSVSITRGASVAGQNFTVQPRPAVAAYNLITNSFLDLSKGTSVYDFSGVNWIQVSPAYISATQGAVQLEVQASSGDAPVPQAATLLGGFSNTQRGAYLYPSPDPFTGRQALWLGLYIPLFSGVGPRHLVLNYGNDLYILPAAVNLVQRPVPTINGLTGNPDGTVTVNGNNLGGDSRVYFDGLPATITATAQNSITVVTPPGIGGHVAIVTVFNSDGQNSTLLGQAPPTYTYSGSGTPQITGVSVRSLPAGTTAAIDITAQNTHFVDGQVTLGFGTEDITVQHLWVTGANTLRANVVVAAGAAPGTSEISVTSGFHVLTLPNGFNVGATAAAFAASTTPPVIGLPIANGDPSQQTIYPGSAASIYGTNFGQNPGAVQVTLNDVPVQLLGATANQINIQIPSNFPTGLATVKVTIGLTTANPVLMEVAAPPPSILRVSNVSGVNYDATHFAVAGDVINIVVSGLDPGVLSNLSRLAVTVSNVAMTTQEIVSLGGGQYQIKFVLTQGFGSTTVPLAVAVDGSSSSPYLIPIR